MRSAAILLFTLLLCNASYGQLQFVSWNVESGGADPAAIAQQLGELPKCHIYALQEVASKDIGRYGDAIRKAHGESYRFFASWTGPGDRLMLAYDSSRLVLQESQELYQHGDNVLNDWRHRSPLVGFFQDKESGQTFRFVTVHLARGNKGLRRSQSLGLSEWASNSRVPILAAGDFNFDYSFDTRQGNRAYELFTDSGSWRWAHPKELIDTNWSDRDGDGVDNYPNSCLDFVFYAGIPSEWRVQSKVLLRAGDFPDDKKTSDHRPVMGYVALGSESSDKE